MKRFAAFLGKRPLGIASVAILCVLYLGMAMAEFIAPYPQTMTFEGRTFNPPNVRLTAQGLRVQETRVVNSVTWKYVRIKDSYSPVRLFAKGVPYRLWGIVPCDRHLFGTTEGAIPVFLMGTDSLGRDLFSRIVYGSRISLTIGFIATAIALLLAVVFGGLAGYFGGAVDWGIMRFSEFFMLIPGLYLILFLRSLLGSSMDSGQSYMAITVILSLVGWPGMARTIRGLVHSIKREEFVMNAQLERIPSLVIIFRHIVPQTASLLIVSVALSVPGFIMSETTLSYLGVGIVDPAVSWGSLIKRDISTVYNLKNYPWLLTPVWLLLTTTLAFNFIGDALRDFLDPYHVMYPRRRLFGKRQDKERGPEKSPRPSSAPLGEYADSPEESFLRVRDLRVSFGAVRAVRGVSFALSRGEILGIVGESGSGKSVTTSAIPGLLPHNASVSGSVELEGVELLGLGLPELRAFRGKRIGMVFQEPGRSYDPLQTMESAFLETFRNTDPRISRDESARRAVALLKEVGLSNARARLSGFPHQFSGGQLQRVGIALALAQGCDLLIADEPTTALDVTIQAQIVALLREIRDARKISIIFISHNIDLVAGISDRIMVMYGGLVMESGKASDVMASPRHPYTKALLAAAPQFGSHRSIARLASIPGRVPDPSVPEPGCPFAPRCGLAEPRCAASVPPLTPRDSGPPESGALRCALAREETR